METKTVRDIRNTNFPGFPLSEPFRSLLGDIWLGFQILIWGPKGMGKSTFALLLLAALSPWAHVMDKKLWYMSGEEGIGAGLQARVDRTGLSNEAFDDLLLSGYKPMSRTDLQEEITSRDVAWIVIDSVETLGFGGNDMYLFLEWARSQDIGVILIAHALKTGDDYRGDSALAHWVDAVIHIYRENGTHYAKTQKSRALDRTPNAIKIPAHVSKFGSGLGSEGVLKVARRNGMCAGWAVTDDEEGFIVKAGALQKKCDAIYADLIGTGGNGEPAEWEPAADEPETGEPEPDEPAEVVTEPDGDDAGAEEEPAQDFESMSTGELMESITSMLQEA